MYRYTVVLLADPDGEGYAVNVPELPGCITEGETVEEALVMAKDATQGYIETLVRTGETVPVESPSTLVTTVDVEEPYLDIPQVSREAEVSPGSD